MNRLVIVLSLVIIGGMALWFIFLGPKGGTPGQKTSILGSDGPVARENPPPSHAQANSGETPLSPVNQAKFFPVRDPDPPKTYLEQRAQNLIKIKDIETNRLSSPQAIRSWSCAEWRSAVENLNWDLNIPQLARWAGALRKAFAEDKELGGS
jgi:hypothetical protein